MPFHFSMCLMPNVPDLRLSLNVTPGRAQILCSYNAIVFSSLI